MRIDYDEDDSLLLALDEMAEDFIYNTTGMKENLTDLYLVAVACITDHFYDNRDFIVQTGAVPQTNSVPSSVFVRPITATKRR